MRNDIPYWLELYIAASLAEQACGIAATAPQTMPPAPASQVGFPAQPVPASHPALERLENRCLLSAVAPHPAAAALRLGSAYSGSLLIPRQHGHPASVAGATLTLGHEAADGTIAGTLVAPGVGSVTLAGRVRGHTLSLSFTGDSTGTASLRIQAKGIRLVGTLRDKSAGLKAKLSVAERVTSTAIASTAVRPAAAGASGATGAPTTGTVVPSDRLEFVGTYSGTLSLAELPANGSASGAAGAEAAPTVPVTLAITSHSADDLLSGTMTIPNIGTYDVVGIVSASQLTFLFAAQGPGYGVGDLKLTVMPGAPSAPAGSTDFGPGGAGAGYGTTQVTLSGTFEDSVNGTLSHRAIHLSGYAGYDPVDTGTDRGTVGTPAATGGAAASNPSLVGAYAGTLLLAQFSDAQYEAGAFTGFSRLGAGDNGITANSVPVTLTISSQSADNFLIGHVSVPGQGTFAVVGEVNGNQTTFLLGGASPAPAGSVIALAGLGAGAGAGQLIFKSGSLDGVASAAGAPAAGELTDEVNGVQGRGLFSFTGFTAAAAGSGSGTGGASSGTGSGTGTGTGGAGSGSGGSGNGGTGGTGSGTGSGTGTGGAGSGNGTGNGGGTGSGTGTGTSGNGGGSGTGGTGGTGGSSGSGHSNQTNGLLAPPFVPETVAVGIPPTGIFGTRPINQYNASTALPFSSPSGD